MKQVEFPVSALPFEKPGFSAMLEDGTLSVSLYYDFREQPLTLKGKAALTDTVKVCFSPYRIELWVNNRLQDEEWPNGKALFTEEDMTSLGAVTPVPTKPIPPRVTGELTDAEGWMPGGGVFVGDCMPYTHGDRYHVLYLKDRHHHTSKWGFGAHQWEHISTDDLVHWQCHPMAVPIDRPWEGSICTGSWIEFKGKQYLYYTIRMAGSLDGAPISRSVSTDGFHFAKDTEFGFRLSGRYDRVSARDPKVFLAEDGRLHMFLCTTDLSVNKGCLAHLVSDDAETWTELEPIVTCADTHQPECPDFFEFKGHLYLVYSPGKTVYQIADTLEGPWRMPEDPIIPIDRVPKASVWRGRLIFTGFNTIGNYAGTMTFLEADAQEDGTLRFFPLKP